MITDHDMPRLSGLDLIRRVRAVPSDMPVIMISGQMPWEELDFPELLPQGTALAKPFSVGEVMSVVSHVFFKGAGTRPVRRRHNNARFQAPCATGIHFNDPL
jgi:DNA-binding response OmpR family regulator